MRSFRFARRDGGFALFEIAVAIFVLSAVLAIGIPKLQAARRQARVDAVAKDLQSFSRAFQSYVHDHGDWPAGPYAAGEIPAGMEKLLSGTNWTQPTPIGGYYAWEPNSPQRGERFRAAIVIASARSQKITADPRVLAALDKTIDDGAAATGSLRLGYRGEPVFLLEP